MSDLTEEQQHDRAEQLGMALLRRGVYAQMHHVEINRSWGVRVPLSPNVDSHPYLFVGSVNTPAGPAWQGETDGMNWIQGGSVFIRDGSFDRVAGAIEALQEYLLFTLNRKPADLPIRETVQPLSSSLSPRGEGGGGALAQLSATDRSSVQEMIDVMISGDTASDWGYEDHDEHTGNRAELIADAAIESAIARVRAGRDDLVREYREGYSRSGEDDDYEQEEEDDDGY